MVNMWRTRKTPLYMISPEIVAEARPTCKCAIVDRYAGGKKAGSHLSLGWDIICCQCTRSRLR
jgi:hypothetical protein